MKRVLPGLLLIGALVVAGCVAVPVREELAGAAGGSLTAVSAEIGGGFGNSGCTLSSAGAISCNSNAIVGGTAVVTGTSTLNGAVTTNGPLTVGTYFNLTKGVTVTVTADSTIAVAKGLTPLTAAGAVGTATLTGCNTSGRISILYNTAAQTITLTDTSTLMLAGNYGMTQYDTLTLIGDGTNCIELARAVN
jgi:hypothetical protein